MILVFCVGTCTAIMVAKVSTDPVIYEGKAAIMLSANESMVVEQDAGGTTGRMPPASSRRASRC
jgi:hypothetical protein